jgi:integrase
MNPTRETAWLEGGRKKGPRTLTLAERTEWLELLEADKKAVRRDLPDLSRFMMATGVRIGEALALIWDGIDIDPGTVAVNYTVIRVKGVGLIRKSTKTEAGERTLPLPAWAVEMLKQRLASTRHPNGRCSRTASAVCVTRRMLGGTCATLAVRKSSPG